MWQSKLDLDLKFNSCMNLALIWAGAPSTVSLSSAWREPCHSNVRTGVKNTDWRWFSLSGLQQKKFTLHGANVHLGWVHSSDYCLKWLNLFIRTSPPSFYPLPQTVEVQRLNQGEDKQFSLNVGSEVSDFQKVKIVQQLSGSSWTVLCINVDHFNLFFILG